MTTKSIIAIALTTISLAACRVNNEHECPKIVMGRIVAETAKTFTLLTNDVCTIWPKNNAIAYSNRFFINDSVAVKYRMVKKQMKIDDVILISHQNAINNVTELFVGSWNDTTSDASLTFNSDMTTSEKEKWVIDGHKMLIHTDNETKEYRIVNVDDKQMTLCYEDKTIHMRRAY